MGEEGRGAVRWKERSAVLGSSCCRNSREGKGNDCV